MESFYKQNQNKSYNLSEQQIVNCIPTHPGGCKGAFVSDAFYYA